MNAITNASLVFFIVMVIGAAFYWIEQELDCDPWAAKEDGE